MRRNRRGKPDQHGRALMENETVLGRGRRHPVDENRRQNRLRLQQRWRLGGRHGTGLPVHPHRSHQLRFPRLRCHRLLRKQNDAPLRCCVSQSPPRTRNHGGLPYPRTPPRRMDRPLSPRQPRAKPPKKRHPPHAPNRLQRRLTPSITCSTPTRTKPGGRTFVSAS